MEYIDIINKIVEAEQKAQRISGEAKDKKVSLPSDLTAEREKIRKSYFDRADNRLKIIDEQEKALMKESLEKLDSQLKEEMKRLDELVDKNRDVWVDKLFTALTEK